jgi:4'-phosphopantetheinyl transferase
MLMVLPTALSISDAAERCCSESRMNAVQICSGPPSPIVLAANCVDCWVISLAAFPDDVDHFAFALLSDDERNRASRLYFERDRHCYVRSHAALRLLLARYLMMKPDAITFAANSSGRPMLSGYPEDFQFNLSHSADAALVAVSRGSALGIDIERIRAVSDMMEIAKRSFTSTEFAALSRFDPEQRTDGFFITWTRKEAFVKGLGLGLSSRLDAICTGRQDRPPRLTIDGAACRGWTIADLSLLEGYKAAVAVRQTDVAVHCQEIGWQYLLKSSEN